MFERALTSDQIEFWNQHRYLALEQPFSDAQRQDLRRWTDEMIEWPETPGKWMKYFEQSRRDDTRLLCRIENFLPFHAPFQRLLEDPVLFEILEELMGEPALLFKEKINLKLPGGDGFGAHQDAPAFTTFGQRFHITMMLAIDDSTVENGCLEVSRPEAVYHTLPQNPDGTIATELEQEMTWKPVELRAGDVLFFDSYLPHRSTANTSSYARRAGFITYNRQSEGDHRTDYFREKRAAFPPDCERLAGVDYASRAGVYNLGNPIR